MMCRIAGGCAAAVAVYAVLVACHSGRASPTTPTTPNSIELAKSLGLEPRPAEIDGVPIRVIDAGSGKPVANALVVSVDEIDFTYADLDLTTLFRRSGKAYVTASDGSTRIAAPSEPRFLLAWHGRDFGRATLEVHDRAEQVIPIEPRDLVVDVVDRAGRPQPDVPVELAQCVLSPDGACVTCGTTGPDGRCTIAAVDLVRSVHRTCGYRYLVMPAALAGVAVIRPLDAPHADPVRFVLPDCGELVVELRDSKERPLSQWLHGKEQLRLVIEGSLLGEPRGLGRGRQDGPSRSLEVACGDEPIHVRQVELGMELSFHLLLQLDENTSGFPDCKVEGEAVGADGLVRGPTRVGENVHVLLRLKGPDDEEDEEAEGAEVEEKEEPEQPAIVANEPTAQVNPEDQENRKDAEQPPSPLSSIELRAITDTPIADCTLRARLDGNRDPDEHNYCPWIDVTGRATMRSIVAGTHSIAIVLSSFEPLRQEIPVWQIDDVEVGPSLHLRDPRLLNIDLRGKLRCSSIDVVDEKGRPLSGRVLLAGDGHGAPSESLDFMEGHYDLVTAASDARRVVIAVDRFRPVELKSPGAHERVVMKRGIPIRIVLDPRATPLKDPKSRLYVGVPERPRGGQPPDEDAEDAGLRTCEVEPGGSARFEIPEPGDWRVLFVIAHPGTEGSEECDVAPAWEPTIHVEERAEEQLFSDAPVRQMKN